MNIIDKIIDLMGSYLIEMQNAINDGIHKKCRDVQS